MIGLTIFKINKSYDKLEFYCSDGHIYTMEHDQDCCESVTIDDISGDLDDLIGTPLLKFEESSSDGKDNTLPRHLYDISHDSDSSTWTFYSLATIKGYVNIRWFGSSNGYYSESVSVNKSSECYLDEWRDYKLDQIIKD